MYFLCMIFLCIHKYKLGYAPAIFHLLPTDQLQVEIPKDFPVHLNYSLDSSRDGTFTIISKGKTAEKIYGPYKFKQPINGVYFKDKESTLIIENGFTTNFTISLKLGEVPEFDYPIIISTKADVFFVFLCAVTSLIMFLWMDVCCNPFIKCCCCCCSCFDAESMN